LTERGPAQLRAGSAWALASVALTLSSSVLRTFVTARFLEPVEIGLLGIALLALGFVEAVASTGVDTALTAGRDVETYIDPGFTIQVARGFAVFGLLWAAAPAIARVFDNGAAVDVVRSVATIAALRGLANPAVVVAVRRLDFRRVFWWSLPEVLTSLFLSIVLVYLRRDVWALVIAVVVGQVVGTIASYGLVRRMPRLVFHRQRILELLRFGRFVSGSRALMYFSVNVDAAVVGVAMGTQALGLYQFATRVAELPVVTFTRAVAQVALPALSGFETGAEAVRPVWRTMLWWVVAVNAASAVVILVFGEAAVHAVAGHQWLPAVPIMRMLAVAMLFRAILVLTGQLLDAVGQPAQTMRLNAVRLAILVVLLAPLAAWGGLRGVALAVLVANAVAALRAARLSARALSS
jgi:O-antigen/teichoic acid export membrane protein